MTNKRFGALLICFGMILVLFVSSAYVAHEAGHDCSGDDCQVCHMIAVNINLLHSLALAFLQLVLFALMRERFAHLEQQRIALSTSGTLVSWKIRLND